MREDDEVVVIPAKPALDLIGGQESIPLGLGCSQAFNFTLQVDSPGAAVPALGQ
jgi:hypothetical protein